jgi:hypothetical protein
MGEKMSISVWTQDEAGPYQTKPYPGASWQKEGQPARQSHEYVRNGTAKILTLFHPLTGQVRVKGVISSANVVLHTPAQRRIEVNPSDASALRSWIKKQIDPYGKPGKKVYRCV